MDQSLKKSPAFITIEGGEGVGKSTLARDLAHWLRDLGHDVIETREPGGTMVAQRIRTIFLDPPPTEPLTARTELYLVSAARAQHVDYVLAPALAQGSWIICDRFHDSSRVYQGVLGGLDEGIVEALIAHSVRGLNPDLTLVLDCDEELALARLKGRGGSRHQDDHDGSRFDKSDLEGHRTIREAFKALAVRFPQRMCLIDASRPAPAIFSDAKSIIKSRLLDPRQSRLLDPKESLAPERRLQPERNIDKALK